MDELAYYQSKKEMAAELFRKTESLLCPYFQEEVIFNSDGFHHLQFSARRERNKKEQILKFTLLPLATQIIKKSGTIQEYRKTLGTVGKKSKDGLQKTKTIEYWGLVAIVGENKIKVRVVLRRVGDGNIIFWSVMSHSKLKNGQKVFAEGIEED